MFPEFNIDITAEVIEPLNKLIMLIRHFNKSPDKPFQERRKVYWTAYTNDLQYLDQTTTSGWASDKGDLWAARQWAWWASTTAYWFVAWGNESWWDVNTQEYFDATTTTWNTSDRADLTVARNYTRWVWVQAEDNIFYWGWLSNKDVIDYVDWTITTWNASDRWDLTEWRYWPDAAA